MKRIIPHLATGRDGRLVELLRPQTLADPGDPLVAAGALAAEGADELAIDGRRTPLAILIGLLNRLAASLTVPLVVQAEPQTVDQAGQLLSAGAARIAIRSRALDDPDFIAALTRNFGSQSIAVALDAVRSGAYWRVVGDSGSPPSEWDAITWARVAEAQGAGELILSSEASIEDPVASLELIRTISAAVSRPIAWIAEAGDVEDLFDALMIGDADAVITGETLRSGRSIPEIKAFLVEHGLPVRMG